MTREIKITKQFKKQYKSVKKNPKWKNIFTSGTMADKNMSPFEYIIECLINDRQIPKYYYVHQLKLNSKIIKDLQKRSGDSHIKISVLELHFDGHNGDHLLVYSEIKTSVFLIAIGTHDDLFK